jgi:RNA polymerase sigma-70 factor (ECF subfamily)
MDYPVIPSIPLQLQHGRRRRARVADGPYPAVFERIMREHNRRLYRLAFGIVGDASAAEDVLQDAYVKAFRNFPKLIELPRLGAWLARIVRNVAVDHCRARKSRQAAYALESELAAHGNDGAFPLERAPGPGRDADPMADLSRDELRTRLEAAIASLPPPFRAVFLLREVEGLSLQQSASYLGVPVATIKTRDHRARLMLRKSLGEAFDLPLAESFDFGRERCDALVARVLARLAPA